MTVNLAIGLFTPPVGLNLYVASGISGAPLTSMSRAIIPYVIASIIVLFAHYLRPDSNDVFAKFA